MEKVLTVATEVQKAIFEQVLIKEILSGFWKDVKPLNHGAQWSDVRVVLGPNLGLTGFTAPRSYNFVNPKFIKRSQNKLLEAAKAVNPEITPKQVKRQLISLNHIIALRLKEIGGEIIKTKRAKKSAKSVSTREKKTANVTVRKVMATFLEDAQA